MMEHAIEMINWNKRLIEETALKTVGFYAQEIRSPDHLIDATVRQLVPAIRSSSERPVTLVIPGVRLTFYGAGFHHRPHKFGDMTFWKTTEPMFVIDDSSLADYPPAYRTKFSHFNQEVITELCDVNKLESRGISRILAFPKEHYGVASMHRAVVINL